MWPNRLWFNSVQRTHRLEGENRKKERKKERNKQTNKERKKDRQTEIKKERIPSKI